MLVVLTISLAGGCSPPWCCCLPISSCYRWRGPVSSGGWWGAWLSLQFFGESGSRVMGVELLDPLQGHLLTTTVTSLTQRAGLPMPAVGIDGSPEWVAFATGPSPQDALVAECCGILEGMQAAEPEAGMAHALSHAAIDDMVTMTLLQGVVHNVVASGRG